MPRFRSPHDKPISLGLTTGHMAVVGIDWTELEPRFRKLAVAEGCEVEGVDAPKDDSTPQPTKDELILAAMRKMLDSTDPTAFTKDGKPDLEKLSGVAGFNVSATERNRVWTKFADETGG